MTKVKLNIANALSLSRVVFLPLLVILVLNEQRTAFLITFIIIGSTDAFDGFVARNFNQVSAMGKRLDSIADMFFYISTAWFFHRFYPEYLSPNLILLGLFFVVYLISFVVSAIRCGKPVMMHTTLLRFNAVLVYILVVTSYWFNTTSFVAVILVLFIVGFIEEIVIFIKFGGVDPDTPSIFTLLKS